MSSHVETFYIASSGACATASLSELAGSISPEILCFHGNELHADQSNVRTPDGEQGIVLRQIDIAKQNQCPVGSVHSIWTGWARNFIHKRGGRTAVLFRDPLQKTFSLFRLNFADAMSGKLIPRRYYNSEQGETIISILNHIHPSLKSTEEDKVAFNLRYNFLSVLLSVMYLLNPVRGRSSRVGC